MSELDKQIDALDAVDAQLLEKIADLVGKPVGALNIRKMAAVPPAPALNTSKSIPALTATRASISTSCPVPRARPATFPS